MRGHGGPAERELQQILRSASDHQGPWPRITIWHGTADHIVVPSNAAALADQWRGVHAVDATPTYSTSSDRNTRQVWCDEAGKAVIEINMVAGMGHGAPVDKGTLGFPGPFMLDVGISSTREIARFWDIAGTETPAPAESEQKRTTGQPDLRHSRAPASANTEDPTSPAIHSSPREIASDPPQLKKIIEDALRAAGLMR